MEYRYPITMYCVTKIHILKFHVMQIRTFGGKRKTDHLIPWHCSANAVLLYFIWELFMIYLTLSFQRGWNYDFYFNSGMHWFIKHLWNSVYVLGTLLDARDTMMTKRCLISGLIEAYRPLEKTGIKGRLTIYIKVLWQGKYRVLWTQLWFYLRERASWNAYLEKVLFKLRLKGNLEIRVGKKCSGRGKGAGCVKCEITAFPESS